MEKSRKLNWGKGFEKFNIFVRQTPGDGHCLIHAISRCLATNYIKSIKKGDIYRARRYVQFIRIDLSEYIEDIDPITNKMIYDTIGNGSLKRIGDEVMEDLNNLSNTNDKNLLHDIEKNIVNNPLYMFTREGLKKLLFSNDFLGHEIIVLLEEYQNINIYVLDEATEDIYVRDILKLNRQSIVIYYSEKRTHFESVFLKTCNGEQILFNPDHPFIRLLNMRQRDIINRRKRNIINP